MARGCTNPAASASSYSSQYDPSSLVWCIGKARTLRIQREDEGIYVSQQKGLENSRHPGLIGSREERIYCFQRYVLTTTGLPVPHDPAEACGA